MKKFLSNFRKKLTGEGDTDYGDVDEEYLELDTLGGDDARSKVVVRPFVIDDFADIKNVLEALREGYTIALVNIKPLKNKDVMELKRAINKLKKTCDAIDGDIAGFGDDYLIIAPSFATIYRSKQKQAAAQESAQTTNLDAEE